MAVRTALTIGAISLLVAAAAPAAHADTPVGVSAGATNVSAYGGYTAWSSYDSQAKAYRLMLRTGDGAVAAAPVAPSPTPFDVTLGPDSRRRPVALYTRCKADPKNLHDVSNGCDAYRLQIFSGKEARLSFSSGADEEWPAQWGDTFVFGRALTTGSGNKRHRCDVPYRRPVSGSHSTRMDHGLCGSITGVALRGSVMAQSVTSFDNAQRSQVRLLSTHGGKATVALQSTFGEESNLLGGVALDASYVYTTREGVHPTPALIRIRRDGLRKDEVPAHLNLSGSIAVDGETISYVDVMGGYKGEDCGAQSPCRIVRSPRSPFGKAHRDLPPKLVVTLPGGGTSGGPFPADQPLTLGGKLTRTTVSAGAVIATTPVAGEPVELLTAAGAPTGLTATTAADGTYAIAVPPPLGPQLAFSAVTRGPGVPAYSTQLSTSGAAVVTASASATTVASGATVTFTGTLSPAQPGRGDVRIQRRLTHKCQTTTSGQQACNDTWATVATATTAPDGRSFTASAPLTQSGVYTAVLPFIQGNPSAYAGRSAEIQITVG